MALMAEYFFVCRSYLQIKIFFLRLIVLRVINRISNSLLFPRQHCLITKYKAEEYCKHYSTPLISNVDWYCYLEVHAQYLALPYRSLEIQPIFCTHLSTLLFLKIQFSPTPKFY